MENVIRLAARCEGEVDPRVVDKLKELLERAERGQIIGLAFVATADAGAMFGWVGSGAMQALAGLTQVTSDLCEAMRT